MNVFFFFKVGGLQNLTLFQADNIGMGTPLSREAIIDVNNLESIPTDFWECKDIEDTSSGSFAQITPACYKLTSGEEATLNISATISFEGHRVDRFILVFDDCTYQPLVIEATGEVPSVSVRGRYVFKDNSGMHKYVSFYSPFDSKLPVYFEHPLLCFCLSRSSPCNAKA